MRNRILVTTVLMIAVGGGCAESVATSPECERWISDYRQKLAQSHPVQVVQKQNGRIRHYVHRQIAVLTHKPVTNREASPRDPLKPGFSPRQMVKRFQVLCGDLPPVQTAELLPPVLPPSMPLTPLAVPATTGTPTTPVEPTLTPFVPSTPVNTPPGGGTLPPPGGGGGTTPPPGGGDTPPPPPTPPPGGGGGDTPPAPPVPEPSSLALMLAGTLAGSAWFGIRRVRRTA